MNPLGTLRHEGCCVNGWLILGHLELPRQKHLVNTSIKQTAAAGQVLWWCKANQMCSLLEVLGVRQVEQEQDKPLLKSHSAPLCMASKQPLWRWSI